LARPVANTVISARTLSPSPHRVHLPIICTRREALALEHSIKLAYRIPEVCRLTGLGKTTVYAAIDSGDLIAHKHGRVTVVLHDDLIRFLRNLPFLKPLMRLSEPAPDQTIGDR
jgi:excisionase family DNA binding protein